MPAARPLVVLVEDEELIRRLLQRIDLTSLFSLVDKRALLSRASCELEQLGVALKPEEDVWPSSMEEFLAEYFQNAGYNNPVKDRTSATKQARQDTLFSGIATVG